MATAIVIALIAVFIIQPEIGILTGVLVAAGLALAGVAVGTLFTCLVRCL